VYRDNFDQTPLVVCTDNIAISIFGFRGAMTDISTTKRVKFTKTGKFRLKLIRVFSAAIIFLDDVLTCQLIPRNC
jgi:hypothetical protein